MSQRDKDILDQAVNGLAEYYQELKNPVVVASVHRIIKVSNTGNDQFDYEVTRDRVEEYVWCDMPPELAEA